MRVYTRGKLVEAFASAGVPKTSTTLRNWEKAGVLPKSPIMIGGKYYYTRKNSASGFWFSLENLESVIIDTSIKKRALLRLSS